MGVQDTVMEDWGEMRWAQREVGFCWMAVGGAWFCSLDRERGKGPDRRGHYLRCSGRLWFCRCHSRRCTLPRCSSPPSWWPASASCRLIGRECFWRDRFRYRLWTISPRRRPCSARRTKSLRPSRQRCSSGASPWNTGRPLQEGNNKTSNNQIWKQWQRSMESILSRLSGNFDHDLIVFITVPLTRFSRIL